MPVSDEPPSEPRMLIYSQDGLGLGHMRRTGLIAQGLLVARPEASVMTLGDSPLGPFFELPPSHHYLKLPTIVKIAPGVWHPASPRLDFTDVLLLRSQSIWEIVSAFQPHLLLVDHMPHGAMGELMPTLQRLQDQRLRTRVVLGLRDILDAPDVIRERWAQEGAYQAIERYYDLVLVYGQPEIFDLVTEYQVPSRVRERLHYCGYVCAPASTCDAARIRARYLAGAGTGTKMILALAGGGADGYPLMSALLDALPAILARHPAVAVLVTGPFLRVDLQRRLQRQACALPAHVLTTVGDTLSYMAAADLVVAMAGYNTSAEILRSGKPAVLIPRAGPSAEQRMRSQFFAARGWVEMLDTVGLSGARVAAAVLGALARGLPPHPPIRPNLQGVTAAVDYLLSLMPPS